MHIKELRDEGRTVLFVEHDMDMVHEISDWVLVMAQGQLIAEGTADQISGEQRRDRRLPRSAPRRRPRWDVRRRRGTRARARRPHGRDSTHPRSGSHHGDRGRAAMTDEVNVIECRDLVAGYVPEVNILNGCDLTVAPGRVRRHHRPERRRQVDAAEGGARAGRDPLGTGVPRTARTSRARSPTSSCRRASASSPRPTTCSRR